MRPPSWIALVVSGIAMILSIVAVCRRPSCPACATPEPAPVAAAPAPTPIPPPPTPEPEPVIAAQEPVAPVKSTPPPAPAPAADQSEALTLDRWMVDDLGRAVAQIAGSYPAHLPAHASADHQPSWRWPPDPMGVPFETLASQLDAQLKLANLPELDDAARRFAGHLAAWMPRWASRQRYFNRGEYLDDDLAAARADEAELRESFATALELWRALDAALEPPWNAQVLALATRAPDSDRAAVDAAWEPCRHVAELALDHAPADKAALADGVAACRAGTDALRKHHLGHYWTPSFLDQLDGVSSSVAAIRRGDAQGARDLPFNARYAAQIVAQLRPAVSDAQAERVSP